MSWSLQDETDIKAVIKDIVDQLASDHYTNEEIAAALTTLAQYCYNLGEYHGHTNLRDNMRHNVNHLLSSSRSAVNSFFKP